MADIPYNDFVTALPAAGTLGNANTVVVQQGGAARLTSLSALSAFFNVTGGGGGVTWFTLPGVPTEFNPAAHDHPMSQIRDMSAFARQLCDDIDASTMRGTLGLGALAVKTTTVTADYGNDSVTDAKLANMPATTVKGNASGASADPANLTMPQLRTMLALDAAAGHIANLPAGTSFVRLTQAAYNALSTAQKNDATKLYLVKG